MAGFDFGKIRVREEAPKPIDPIEIFPIGYGSGPEYKRPLVGAGRRLA